MSKPPPSSQAYVWQIAWWVPVFMVALIVGLGVLIIMTDDPTPVPDHHGACDRACQFCLTPCLCRCHQQGATT